MTKKKKGNLRGNRRGRGRWKGVKERGVRRWGKEGSLSVQTDPAVLDKLGLLCPVSQGQSVSKGVGEMLYSEDFVVSESGLLLRSVLEYDEADSLGRF